MLLVSAAVLVVLALVLPCVALMGVLDSDTVTEPAKTVLRIGMIGRVDSLNPFLGSSEASRFLYGLIYDCLQAQDEDGETTPNLAVDWHPVAVSDPAMVASGEPYGSVWEYNISPNVVWHDGQPFTAQDVAWNLNLNCLGANFTDMAAYATHTYFMKFAEAIDVDTVRVHFYDRETGASIPFVCADFLPIFMMPRHLLEEYDTSYISFLWPGWFNNSDLKVVGTGPFMPGQDIDTEFATGNRLTLFRNVNYHWKMDKSEETSVDRLDFYFFDDDTAMKLALYSGGLDLAKFPPSSYASIEHDLASGRVKSIGTSSNLGSSQYWISLAINLNAAGGNEWRLDPIARHALAHAVNRTHIVEEIYDGLAVEGSGIISPVAADWHWDPPAEERIDYDLVEAAAVLEAAGYVDVDNDTVRECTATCAAVLNDWAQLGDELNLETVVRLEHPEEKEIAMYLQDEWAKIGIDMTYEVVSEHTISPMCLSCYQIQTLIWPMGSGLDPNQILFEHTNRSMFGWQDTWCPSDSFDENYTSSVQEFNTTSRMTHVINCQRICYEDSARIVLAYVNSNFAWRTDTFTGWGNWTAHPGLSIGSMGTSNSLLFNIHSPNGYRGSNDFSGWAYAIGIASAGAAFSAIVASIRSVKTVKRP